MKGGNDETVLVCERITTPLIMPDNRLGNCSECGTRVQFRPHAPKLRRICVTCALDITDSCGIKFKIAVTRHTIEEVNNYLAKRRH